MIIRRAELFYTEGSSDKQYNVVLEEQGGTYAVNASYGRRGGNMKAAPQGSGLDLAAAEILFTKTVNSKTSKGYKVGTITESASEPIPLAPVIREREDTDMRAQLLTPIDDPTPYLANAAWVLEEKHDGERLLVRKNADGTLTFANRKGQRTEVPAQIREELEAIPGTFVLDGENVRGTYYVFDLLEHNGVDLRPRPYEVRRMTQNAHLGFFRRAAFVRQVEPISEGKAEAMAALHAAGKEGVVFKRLSAPWSAGRSLNAIKYKFWSSASCIVSGHNDRSSITVELIDDNGRRIPAGNVTVTGAKPPVGSVVEIQYLYVVCPGAPFYQPVFLGQRHDTEPAECTTSQIRYKGAA